MWVPWIYKEASGKASEVRGDRRAELQEERMTHNKGGSVPGGLPWQGKGHGAGPTGSKLAKNLWHRMIWGKQGKAGPTGRGTATQEATTRMRTSCVVTGGSELRSMGNKRHCLAVSARAEDNHPWRQQGMAGACGKVLSSGHKLKGGARGGPWEQRGALHEAYWPLCFTSVFLQKACQDELMFHCFWFLLLWTLYSHCPHIGSANPGFGAWETKSVKNEWLPDSGLARLVNTAATFVCWSGDLCLVCTLCCGSKFTPHLWIFPRIYFLVHCSTTARPAPLEAVNLGHRSGLLRPWGLPRVASVTCVQGNGWSLFSNRVYIFTFNAH